MGTFLSLSGVIGKTQDQVVTSLTSYANSVKGNLQADDTINSDNENSCIIQEQNGNTTIFYPNGYIEWDASSEYISKELKAPVFSCHIHDGDLWMYVLYFEGQIIDQFNPIPDYWEDIDEKEIKSWKGNASIVAKYIPNLEVKDIEKYLVRWDVENEDSYKAYSDDEFTNEDWQLTDFIKKWDSPIQLIMKEIRQEKLINFGQGNCVYNKKISRKVRL